MTERLPREGLVRAQPHGIEMREDAEGAPLMRGHFAVFDEWTEINSGYEGNFLERIAPGAFKKTLTETTPKVLFNHGHDVMGDQILGVPKTLEEDDRGAYYEVELFDGVPQLIRDGLKANQYGSSFRFRVMREDVRDHPEKSDYNPKGLPERTIKEAQVFEFGPVSFPAYAGATAGMRSMTDRYLAERIGLTQETPDEAPTDTEAPAEADAVREDTSEQARRDADPVPDPSDDTTRSEAIVDPNATLADLEAREKDIETELQRMDADAGTGILNETEQERWDKLVAERDEIRTQRAAKMRRLQALNEGGVKDTVREGGFSAPTLIRSRPDSDIYDLSTVRGAFDNPAYAKQELRDRAMHAIERQQYPHLGREASKEDMQANVQNLLDNVDDDNATLARRILTAGHPEYENAFFKKLTGRQLSASENNVMERAALLTATAGYAMPIALDPTVVLTSNGAVNPIRDLARVVQIAGKTWNGVNSAGITASYDAEQAEVSEDTPTLTQPTVTVLKAAAFVPFSIEAEAWSDIRNELTVEMRDAKDVLEANKFTLGTGTAEPTGFMRATNLATTAATATIALADIDTLMDALPPRFQSNAALLGSRKFFSKVRQLARTAGVNDQWPNVAPPHPGVINGAPAYQASDIVSTLTTSAALVAAYGDFNRGFVIVDRVGMSVEYIPHLFHTSNNRPSGTRGLYSYWMNNSIIRSEEALRLLKVL